MPLAGAFALLLSNTQRHDSQGFWVYSVAMIIAFVAMISAAAFLFASTYDVPYKEVPVASELARFYDELKVFHGTSAADGDAALAFLTFAFLVHLSNDLKSKPKAMPAMSEVTR